MELHVACTALVGMDPHRFEPDQGLQNFGRFVKDDWSCHGLMDT